MFYASLGECITSWAAIERELFELFHRALGVERLIGRQKAEKNACRREVSVTLFWTFPTFGTPLSYTSMLVRRIFSKTADGSKTKPQKYWKKLRDDLEELAHCWNACGSVCTRRPRGSRISGLRFRLAVP